MRGINIFKNLIGAGILFFLVTGTAAGQSADDIIYHNLQNSGGVKNWKNLNSLIIRGDALLSLEESYSLIIYHERPYRKKVAFIVGGKEILNEGYDGKNGWTYNQNTGKNEPLLGYQPDSFENDLLDFKRKGYTADYKGKETFEGKECYKVELTKNTNKTTYCFSVTDYSLLWEENKDEKQMYYDYKKFNGLEFATRIIAQPKGGGEYVLKFNSIKINPKIDNKIFSFK